MTRVLVCGGRDFRAADHLFSTLDRLHLTHGFTALIEGGARGADRLARRWAKSAGVPVESYPADWDTYGRSAGSIRNRQMLVEGRPDLIVAFKGGSGTDNMVWQADRRWIEIIRA